MALWVPELMFMDALNFAGGMTLAKFGQIWANNDAPQKGLFPYSYFKSVKQIRDQTEFPAYSAFRSELQKPDFEQ